jgi:hypothetical protein
MPHETECTWPDHSRFLSKVGRFDFVWVTRVGRADHTTSHSADARSLNEESLVHKIFASDTATSGLFRLLKLVVSCVDLPLFQALYAGISEQSKMLCESCHLCQPRLFHCSALSFQGLHLSDVPFRPDVVFDLAL